MPASPLSNSAVAAVRNKPQPLLLCLLLLAALPCVAANTAPAPTQSEPWHYRVVARAEQDRALFTQGFAFDRDTLWISSGLYAQSHVVALDPENRTRYRIDLPKNLFGEGLAVAHDTLWILSWREQRVLRYDLATQKPLRPLYYEGEGWGLTFDGKNLIRSDGTSLLHFHRSSNFRVVRTLKVTDRGKALNNLNELEWIDGFIFANIWLTNIIAIIDPANGHVVGRIDLGGLLPATDMQGDTDVLNGIAWNAHKKELWVTGKRWPARFRIEIIKPYGAKGL